MEFINVVFVVVVVMAVLVLPLLFKGGTRESDIGIQLLKL